MRDPDTWRRDLDRVHTLCSEEIDLIRSLLHKSSVRGRPVLRRAMVRAAFALIEAMAYSLKTTAALRPGPGSLSPRQVALAREEDYELSDKGEVTIRSARLPFLKNLRFAFIVHATACTSSFRLDVSGKGWQALQRAIKVRDRLMHPKTARDLEVTDDEELDTIKALTWLYEQVTALHISATAALTTETKRLRNETRALKEETKRIQQDKARLAKTPRRRL